jgi:DNA replication and repair protein RecF
MVHGDRGDALLEVELNPGKANRVRLNRTPLPRPREILGMLRTVLFAPEDLALVKGDPGERRRFLDDLLVATAPRYAGVRADYERVVKQRTALLKSAGAKGHLRGPAREAITATLDAWDAQLAKAGAPLLAGRLRLAATLRPHVVAAYAAVSGGSQQPASISYRSSVPADTASPDTGPADTGELEEALLKGVAAVRSSELDRGVCLVGPHRDELELAVGALPARGYASHGESWSLALALRLASFALLRDGQEDPVLILDDVFAELDTGRRDRLATLVADAEQVLITAAVLQDVPAMLSGARFSVADGTASRD